uniref:Phosphoglycolate phosphatase n=1 Tax=Pinguiococcus pyrenoidosus TaxID=172671 RepID=A0A7R9Y882_9STRA|mmetsp:Transcript_12079/g.44829  ORF Transcript_12079/g.44829 Transcript_12079/m.44829 type:complete len:315 (+) Transcript_12079:77-1021(+)
MRRSLGRGVAALDRAALSLRRWSWLIRSSTKAAMGTSFSSAAEGASVLSGGEEASAEFVKRHDAFIFDCDGVLWHGARGIEGAREAILSLRASGRKVLFVTNNSTKAREDYVQTFRERLDLEVRQEDVIAASWAAAAYLKQCSDPRASKPKIMLIGMSGLTKELSFAGYEVLGGPAFNGKTVEDLERELDFEHLDEDVGTVVTGLDKDLNYYKVAMAAAYVQKGCLFVASNTDATLPMKPNGTFGPGAGLSSAAVLNTAGRDAVDAVAGKPSALLGATVCETFGLDPSRYVARRGHGASWSMFRCRAGVLATMC